MPNTQEIEVSVDAEKDVTFTFPPAGGVVGRAWVTVDPNDGRPRFSVGIAVTDEGIVVDVFPDQGELGEPVASTYAFDSDVSPEDEEAL